jgi:ABC-type Mn2+/Zn2+ transport system ATPase subunit
VTIGWNRPLLSRVDLSIPAGDFLALVGPNGAGKSTLLYTLLGMLPPLAGTVRRAPGVTAGFVPQRGRHDPIFPLRVLDVVAAGGMGAGSRGAMARLRWASAAEARAALEELGIAELARLPFRDLSGGQQQRVLVARALVRRPKLLVLDEPTAGMDLPSENDLLSLVSRWAATRGTAVVFVTHQLALAAQVASRIALIHKDHDLFAVDATDRLLTGERLTALYGREVEVLHAHGAALIRLQAKRG